MCGHGIVKACAQSSHTACARLPPRLWVSLEPDNAVAWIWLAKRDSLALPEALHQIQLARRYDDLQVSRLRAEVAQARERLLQQLVAPREEGAFSCAAAAALVGHLRTVADRGEWHAAQAPGPASR